MVGTRVEKGTVTGTTDRARLYQSLRTAHLERAHQLPRARLIYAGTRYDFDEALAEGLDLVDGRGARAAIELVRRPPDSLEINEPLMLESALWTLATVTALRVRTLGRRQRVALVTYAIENRDPRGDVLAPKLRTRVRRAAELFAARVLARQVERIAYGTAAAQRLYEDFGTPPGVGRLVWALPAHKEARSSSGPVAVFASAFSLRKGIDTLLQSWPAVVRALPDARLVLIGSGAELPRVLSTAGEDATLRVLLNPPRSEVLEQIQASRVVVLPSRPTPDWREQVGLPIVEGLAYGRTIVTTPETGLADWLAEHGHQLVPPDDPVALAAAMIAALSHPLDVREVTATLPAVDGRVAADAWMFGDPA